MCELPAKSMPGSEMLIVENTRILGMFSRSPESPDIEVYFALRRNRWMEPASSNAPR